MVRTERDGIAGLCAHRARQGSLPFPSFPCASGHCGTAAGGAGPGGRQHVLAGQGRTGRGHKGGGGAPGAASWSLPLLSPDSFGPFSGRCWKRSALPRVSPLERTGLKWLICAFHAAFPAPPLCSEEGKAGACVGGLWKWHAETPRPPYHRGLLRSSNKLRSAGASCCRAVGGQLLVSLQRSFISARYLLQCSWLRP